jgi:hypothetical protein
MYLIVLLIAAVIIIVALSTRLKVQPCYSQNLTSEHLTDFAEMAGIECVLINKGADLRPFRMNSVWSKLYYR